VRLHQRCIGSSGDMSNFLANLHWRCIKGIDVALILSLTVQL
jgi:hypothetical protein